jgi:hypothetical protein
MAKKHEKHEAGELIESKERPAAFVPNPIDPTKAVQVGPMAVDMTDFEGEWYKQDEPPDSEPYGRKIVPDDIYGHTVHMKNQDHYWSGTPESFKLSFSKSAPEETQSAEPPAV